MNTIKGSADEKGNYCESSEIFIEDYKLAIIDDGKDVFAKKGESTRMLKYDMKCDHYSVGDSFNESGYFSSYKKFTKEICVGCNDNLTARFCQYCGKKIESRIVQRSGDCLEDDIFHCPFCEKKIEDCVCGASIDDMRAHISSILKKHNLVENNEEYPVENGNKTLEFEEKSNNLVKSNVNVDFENYRDSKSEVRFEDRVDEGFNVDEVSSDKRNNDDQDFKVKVFDVRNTDKTFEKKFPLVKYQWDHRKWKCGGCRLINEYSSRNCDACGTDYKVGRWICGQCSRKNCCDEEECKVCGVRNGNLVIVNDVMRHNKEIGHNPKGNINYADTDSLGYEIRQQKGNIHISDPVEKSSNIHEVSLDKRNNQDQYLKVKVFDVRNTDKTFEEKLPLVKYQWDHRKWKCGGCGLINEYSSRNCDACGTDYKFGRWICGQCSMKNCCEEEECKVCGVRNGNLVLVNDARRNNEADPIPIIKKRFGHTDKWKCGGCELLNEYSFVNCVACGGLYEDGGWTCKHCTMENICAKHVCEICGERNDNLMTGDDVNENPDDIVHANKPKHIPADTWMCGGCYKQQPYAQATCCNCHLDKYIHGLWMCVMCKCLNMYAQDNCVGCYTINNYLTINYCQYCERNGVSEMGALCDECTSSQYVPWKCSNHFIKVDNKGSDKNCGRCGLYRFSIAKGDNERKQWHKGKERTVWTCSRCGSANDLSLQKCSKFFCHQKRKYIL